MLDKTDPFQSFQFVYTGGVEVGRGCQLDEFGRGTLKDTELLQLDGTGGVEVTRGGTGSKLDNDCVSPFLGTRRRADFCASLGFIHFSGILSSASTADVMLISCFLLFFLKNLTRKPARYSNNNPCTSATATVSAHSPIPLNTGH